MTSFLSTFAFPPRYQNKNFMLDTYELTYLLPFYVLNYHVNLFNAQATTYLTRPIHVIRYRYASYRPINMSAWLDLFPISYSGSETRLEGSQLTIHRRNDPSNRDLHAKRCTKYQIACWEIHIRPVIYVVYLCLDRRCTCEDFVDDKCSNCLIFFRE